MCVCVDYLPALLTRNRSLCYIVFRLKAWLAQGWRHAIFARSNVALAETIRILVADSHTLVHVALQQILEQTELKLLPERASTLEDAVRMCRQHKPYILLLAVRLLSCVSLDDLVGNFFQICPEMRIVLVGDDDDDDDVCAQKLIQAQVSGYICCSSAPEAWRACLESVAYGGVCYDRSVALGGEAGAVSGGAGALTEREKALLALLAAGYANREIAKKLNLSPHTVRNNLSDLYEKLDVSSRREAAAWALRQGVA